MTTSTPSPHRLTQAYQLGFEEGLREGRLDMLRRAERLVARAGVRWKRAVRELRRLKGELKWKN